MDNSIPPRFIGNKINAHALPSKQKVRNKSIRLFLLGTLVVAGTITYRYWLNQPKAANDVLKLSGRIEGYETDISVKRSGRIESIAVREGTSVKKGQELIKLDNSNDQLLQEQLNSAEARISLARYEEQQTRANLDRIEGEIEQVASQIQEAQLNLQQSQGDTEGKVYQAQSTVAAARAQLFQAQAQVKQAEAELQLAKVNSDRYIKLHSEGAISQQQLDQAQSTLGTATAVIEARQATVNAAREQLNAAQGSLTQAQTTSFNPSIRRAQLAGLQGRLKQSYAQLKAMQSEVKSAQAKVRDALAFKQQILTQIIDAKKDLNVVSPLDGVVTARNVEPGAVVTSQTKILTVINPNALYFRGFIPEGDIGKVRVGQVVKIFLDSDVTKPLPGKIISIDPQASFTPENIYFQKDRVKQVVGIRISVQNPSSCLNPENPYSDSELPCAKIGMPGDAEIVLKR